MKRRAIGKTGKPGSSRQKEILGWRGGRRWEKLRIQAIRPPWRMFLAKRRFRKEDLTPNFEKVSYPGELDQELKHRYRDQWRNCSKGRLNSPNAQICWKCGEPIQKKEERKVSV